MPSKDKYKYGLHPYSLGIEENKKGVKTLDEKKYVQGNCIFPYKSEGEDELKYKCYKDEDIDQLVCPTKLKKDGTVENVGVCYDIDNLNCEIDISQREKSWLDKTFDKICDANGFNNWCIGGYPNTDTSGFKNQAEVDAKRKLLKDQTGLDTFNTNSNGTCLFHSIVGSYIFNEELGKSKLDKKIKTYLKSNYSGGKKEREKITNYGMALRIILVDKIRRNSLEKSIHLIYSSVRYNQHFGDALNATTAKITDKHLNNLKTLRSENNDGDDDLDKEGYLFYISNHYQDKKSYFLKPEDIEILEFMKAQFLEKLLDHKVYLEQWMGNMIAKLFKFNLCIHRINVNSNTGDLEHIEFKSDDDNKKYKTVNIYHENEHFQFMADAEKIQGIIDKTYLSKKDDKVRQEGIKRDYDKFGVLPDEVGISDYDRDKYERGVCRFPYNKKGEKKNKYECFQDEDLNKFVCPTKLNKDKTISKLGVCYDISNINCDLKDESAKKSSSTKSSPAGKKTKKTTLPPSPTTGKKTKKSSSTKSSTTGKKKKKSSKYQTYLRDLPKIENIRDANIRINWMGAEGSEPRMQHPVRIKDNRTNIKYRYIRKKTGYAPYETLGDGNCLFHAVVGSIFMAEGMGKDWLDNILQQIIDEGKYELRGNNYGEVLRSLYLNQIEYSLKNYREDIIEKDLLENNYNYYYGSVRSYPEIQKAVLAIISLDDVQEYYNKQIAAGFNDPEEFEKKTTQNRSQNPKPLAIDIRGGDIEKKINYLEAISYYYESKNGASGYHYTYDLSERDIDILNLMVEQYINYLSDPSVYTDAHMARAVCQKLGINMIMHQVAILNQKFEYLKEQEEFPRVYDKSINIYYNYRNHYEAMGKYIASSGTKKPSKTQTKKKSVSEPKKQSKKASSNPKKQSNKSSPKSKKTKKKGILEKIDFLKLFTKKS